MEFIRKQYNILNTLKSSFAYILYIDCIANIYLAIVYCYSIYANGASGGKGYDNQVQGKGDQIRALVKLSKGEQLFILVGQMGVSGCRGCQEIAVRCNERIIII